jgi:hypothetical protein
VNEDIVLQINELEKRELVDYNNTMRKLSNPRSHWIAMRRSIMAEIIAANPNVNWTSGKLAEAMLEDPRVREAHPRYSSVTAQKDFLSLTRELSDKRTELVEDYLSIQLELTDDILTDLTQEWNDLLEEEVVYDNEEAPPIMQRVAKIKAMNTLSMAMERAMVRQSKLLPLDVPKQINVEKRSFNLDMYLEAKERREKAIEDNTIDANYEYVD